MYPRINPFIPTTKKGPNPNNTPPKSAKPQMIKLFMNISLDKLKLRSGKVPNFSENTFTIMLNRLGKK